MKKDDRSARNASLTGGPDVVEEITKMVGGLRIREIVGQSVSGAPAVAETE